MLTLVLADLEDRHDAGVIEIRGGLGLGVEALTSVSLASWPARIIFKATVRLRLICLARNTTPMPPRAISRMIS